MSAHENSKVYAFIDSQNLKMGVCTDVIYKGRKLYDGWELDFKKFRRYLADKYRVDTAFLFIGQVVGNERLYEYLQRAGFVVIFKPTTLFTGADGKPTVKGNVDTDLVLYAAAKEIDNYAKAIIVSGDGDFLSLYEYLESLDKLGKILIPNKHRYSQLLTKYFDYFDYVSVNKVKLQQDRHIKRRV